MTQEPLDPSLVSARDRAPEDRLPKRPIAAPGLASRASSGVRTLLTNLKIPFWAFPDQQPYNDVGVHVRER